MPRLRALSLKGALRSGRALLWQGWLTRMSAGAGSRQWHLSAISQDDWLALAITHAAVVPLALQAADVCVEPLHISKDHVERLLSTKPCQAAPVPLRHEAYGLVVYKALRNESGSCVSLRKGTQRHRHVHQQQSAQETTSGSCACSCLQVHPHSCV